MFGLFVGPGVVDATEPGDSPVDEPETETGDAERAQEFFDRGAELYFQQEYGRAIVEFRRAHEAHSHPLFLYNIALSSLRIDNYEQALNAAQQAEEMEAQLPPENSARNRSMIASIETVYRTREVAEDVELLDELEDPEELDEPPVADEDVDAPSRFGTLGWTGVAGLGLGAAALGGAGVMEMQVRSRWDDIEEDPAGMSDDEFDRRLESIERRQDAGRIMLFAGAGLMAAGGALLGIEGMTGGEDDQQVAVRPTLRGLDVTVRW